MVGVLAWLARGIPGGRWEQGEGEKPNEWGSWMDGSAYLAILALPYEIRFAPTARLFVLFLVAGSAVDRPTLSLPFVNARNTSYRWQRQFRNSKYKANGRTYESAHGDPIRVDFATGRALHFEGVVEGVLFRVIGLEVCYAGGKCLGQFLSCKRRRRCFSKAYPSNSAVRAMASISASILPGWGTITRFCYSTLPWCMD